MQGELSHKEILQLVHDLASFHIREIRFTGGEPTVHPVLEQAIALATKLNVTTSIGSNAVAITKKSASQLFEAGLQKAIISLDGDEPRNDAIRGRYSFQRSWHGIRALRTSNIDVRINAVAMKTTLKGLLPLAELCAQEGVRLFIRRYIPCGRALGDLSELLTITDYEDLRAKLQFFIQEGVVDGHHLSPNRHNVCSAGTSGFVILPNGDVKSCGFLSELVENSYGNILSEELSEIWNRLASFQLLGGGESSLEIWSRNHPNLPRTNCPAVAISENQNEALVLLRRKPS